MALQIALLIATVLVALATARALWHSIGGAAAPPDRSLLPHARAQRAVRRYGVWLGILEGGALAALLIALFSVPSGSAEMWLLGLAALCVALMIGVWAAYVRPLNARIADWSPEAPPDDWAGHHARWSTFHRARIALAIIALALLLMGLFPGTAV
jgi:hypothetical protein